MSEQNKDDDTSNIEPSAPILLHGLPTEAERLERERNEYQKERDRKDDTYKRRQIAIERRQLVANRRISTYTLILAILTGFGTVVSYLASQAAQEAANASTSAAKTARDTLDNMEISGGDTKIQIGSLIRQQQRTAEATVSAAKSASASVKVATNGLASNRESFQIGDRAYIGMSEAFVNGADEAKGIPERLRVGLNIFDVEIANKGHTPANNIRSWGAAQVVTQLFETDTPTYPLPPERRVYKNGRALSPGDKDYLKPGGFINPLQYPALFTPPVHTYFMAYGVSTYADVFGITHTSKFCIYFDITQQDIGFCPAHNTIE